MENFDYTFKPNNKEVLSSEEVYFFYYDVMRTLEDSTCCIFDWDENIQKYLDCNKISITDAEIIPFEDVDDNCIYFLIDSKKDGTNKACAFIRHLRNAFAHFQITHDGEYIRIKDCLMRNSKLETITMLGKIKYEDLKKLCFLFIDQKQKFIEELNLKVEKTTND